MITYLLSSKPLISSQKIDQIPSIHSDEFLAFNKFSNSLEIFTLDDSHILQLNLSIHSINNYYFTKTSSHILLVNEKNILSIYFLKTSKLLWTTNEFENKKLQIHSLQSSFIFICLQTKEIFLIDTKSLKLKNLTQLPNDCLLSTVTSNNQLYIISNDQTTLIEFNIDNQNLTILPSIHLNSSKIIQLYSISDYLVFHTDNNQIYLWCKENERITELESSSHLISKDNRLVLVGTDNKTLILYDLKEKLRGIIRLDDDAGQCEAINLSDNNKQDEQYLFIICHDRFLRMYCVSNGKQLVKLFIHTNLYSFIGILTNRLLLKVDDYLCIIKIIDKKSLAKR
jgi:WD40 repeat protein